MAEHSGIVSARTFVLLLLVEEVRAVDQACCRAAKIWLGEKVP